MHGMAGDFANPERTYGKVTDTSRDKLLPRHHALPSLRLNNTARRLGTSSASSARAKASSAASVSLLLSAS